MPGPLKERPDIRRKAWIIAAGLASLGVIFAGLFCFDFLRPGARKPQPIDSVAEHVDDGDSADLARQLTVENPGYLGPKACAACHAERVAEFQLTRHFLANCVPDPATMPQGFQSGQNQFSIPESPRRFMMEESDGRFRENTTDPDGSRPASSEIAFVYGAAGGNDEVYFSWRHDTLRELPLVWLAPLKTWGASPFDRHGHGDLSREMTIRCVECHNTWLAHTPGSRNQYGRDDVVMGVTCEVCHGPGREHADFHSHHPEVTAAHAVVRPAQLSRERQMDLCAQCHSNALKHRGPAFQYRPGKPLDESYYSLHTKHPEDDHVANQTTYLRQSRCFQQTETLTCVTCHNPHQHRSETNAGTTSCRNCHGNEGCKERLRLPAAVRDDCIGCHMPEHRKIQVYFRTETDKYVAPVKRYEHNIGVYPLARDAVLLKWLQAQTDPQHQGEAVMLAKQLSQAWFAESQSREAEFRFLAAIDACRESLRFESNPTVQEKLQSLISLQSEIDSDYQLAQWHEREHRESEAIAAYRRVLAVKPDFAMAHGRLGTTYAASGERQLAQEHLEQAAKLDPDEPYAPAMLGWLTYLDGKPEDALKYYLQADAVEPYSARIHHQIGLALMRLNRWPEAIERLSRGATIDPQEPAIALSLSQACLQSKQTQEALKFARRAAYLTQSEDAGVLLNLAEVYADAQDWSNAIKTAEQALAVSLKSQPKLSAQIRIRLDELRTRRNPRR
jgi:tetratricopeptide (TPR) repeat protein